MHRLVLRLWAHHQPAVLLVTHDVDEALALSDRVLVLAGGQIALQRAHRRTPAAGARPPGTGRPANPPAHRARRRHGRMIMINKFRGITRTQRPRARPGRRRRGPARPHRGGLLLVRDQRRLGAVLDRERQDRQRVQRRPARRRPGGLRLPGAAHRGRPAQQAAVQGRMVRLHLRAADAPGHGLRRDRHRQRRRRPAGVRGRGRGEGRHRRRGDRRPERLRDRRAGQLADPLGRPAQGQEDRRRAGQLGRLPPAHRAEQGRPVGARRVPWTTCSPPTAWPR